MISLPEPQRQNLQKLVDSWLKQVAQGVAESRGLTPEAVVKAIDEGPWDAASGPDLGLVDQLGYWDEVNEAVLTAAGDEAEFLRLDDYDTATAESENGGSMVALVYGLGPIVLGQSENDPVFGSVTMGSDSVAAALADAVDDPDIEAILFRVDSPGGSYVASDSIWREVQRAADAGKPLIISMGNFAASGGYFVAAPAQAIVVRN